MTGPRSWTRRDQTADLAWKWLLRLTGISTFVYVLLGMHGEVPVAVYVLIGGLIGLPNVVSLQGLLNQSPVKPDDEDPAK